MACTVTHSVYLCTHYVPVYTPVYQPCTVYVPMYTCVCCLTLHACMHARCVCVVLKVFIGMCLGDIVVTVW